VDLPVQINKKTHKAVVTCSLSHTAYSSQAPSLRQPGANCANLHNW